jgi:hypothetical protein
MDVTLMMRPVTFISTCLVMSLAAVLLVSGCSTDSYYRDTNTLVTVKRFAGIPYLEKEEHVKRKQVGPESVPVR